MRADPAWVAATAKKIGMAARAGAYAGVAISFDGRECGTGWNTLAGIGEIESRHGTIFGGRISADGTATPAIFAGAARRGRRREHPDSDKGAIEGDSTIDRAVGPMQLIPEAWRNGHADGNADGVQNLQNIDDATLAAAAYLCSAGGSSQHRKRLAPGGARAQRVAAVPQRRDPAFHRLRERRRACEIGGCEKG